MQYLWLFNVASPPFNAAERQNPKYVIMVCANHARNCSRLYRTAGTDRYQEILSTGKGFGAVARWVMSEGLLVQFLLAKQHIDRVEGRVREDNDEGALERE